MNKKWIIIVAVALVVVIAGTVGLVVVLNRARDSDEGDQFIPAGWQAEIEDLGETKLSFYFEAQQSRAMNDVLQAVNRKLKDDIGAEISFEFIWENPERYLDRIRQDIAAGLPCDAFYYSSYFPISIQSLVKENLVMDLTELFPQVAYQYYGQFTNEDIDALSVNGKLYSIPARLPGAIRKCAIVRQDLMEKYNIPAIHNYDDYEFFLKTIKENEPDMIPMNYWDTTLGLFSDVNGYVNVDYEMGLVYRWDNSSVKIEAWEQTPVFMESMNRIKGWYEKEYLTKNVGIAEIDDFMVTNGKWASFIGNWGDQFNYNTIVQASELKDMSYAAYQLYDGISARNPLMESGLLVSSHSKNAEKVLQFVNWLQSSQENYDLFMYGVEGTHYIQKEDYIKPPEDTDMSNTFYQWGWKSPFRNIDFERASFPDMKKDVQQYYEVITNSSKYPPHIGFYPDYSTVNDIATLRRMGFSSLDRKVYTGFFEQQDVIDYIKEQKDFGMDNLVEEIQRQLDEYLLKR